ncbi:hypothetical protein I8D50_000291 [Vibrio vulnificus]|nr:hypothetical protein [Vibrio vulnificus]EHU9456083.1 hypothetical protein [Vibrio vulnificus]EHU9460538.1 hypothetical protein [Vibrio vulnificus]MCU8314324.1 hypothetical protein [Vibrio vulnificus]HAS6191376.1 hypothetical protein [Vibrio vulnificus]
MIKNTLVVASSVLLFACGGGGGGGSTATGESADGQGKCGNMPEMACTYSLAQLTSEVTFSHAPDPVDETGDRYNVYIDMKGAGAKIQLPDDHRFELMVDGTKYPFQQNLHQILFVATDVPANGQTYEISWYKGDVLVESNALQSLAKSVKASLDSYALNEVQLRVLNWQPVEYSYEADPLSVVCVDSNNVSKIYPLKQPKIFPLDTGIMTFSLPEHYGLEYNQLSLNYQSCQLDVRVHADKKLQPREAMKKMNLISSTDLLAEHTLF